MSSPRSTAATAPTAAGPFAVEGEWLARLDAKDLVAIVDQLLRAEAGAQALPGAQIDVPSHLNAPDGGEDGRITWQAGPERTARLPGRLVQFQLKATPMTPSQARKEIRVKGAVKGGALQPMVAQVLDQGGAYLLLCTHRTAKQGRQRRDVALRETVRESGRTVPDDRIEYVDGDLLAGWINDHPAVARRTRELLSIPAGGPFRSWYDEYARAEHARSTTVPDARLDPLQAELAARLVTPKGVARVAGSTGVGKSRLVLDAIGDLCVSDDGQKARPLALFVRVGHGNEAAVVAAVEDLARFGQRVILVVDDCSEGLHDTLAGLVMSVPSMLSLVTLTDDFRTQQASRPEWIVVAPAPDTMIDALLEAAAPQIDRGDRRRLVDLSLGYPGAALDMAGSWGHEGFASGLSHDGIVERVVLGRRPCAGQEVELMEAARLVAVVGKLLIDPPASADPWRGAGAKSEQMAELAALSRLQAGPLRRLIVDLAERGACRRHGRAVRLEPLPIAWHLAQSYWQALPPERWDEIIAGDVLAPHLRSQALDVLVKLNTTDIGNRVARHVCRRGGPFDRSDVLENEACASALAQLSDIDATAVLRRVEKALDGLDLAGIASLAGESRRHLITILERTAETPALFEPSVGRLLDLAEASRHHHGVPDDRVEGVLRVLFWPLWSNTRACSEHVIRCVDAELDQGCETRRQVIAGALAGGVTTKGFSRTVAPARAGTRTAEMSEGSRTWQQVFDHVRACGDRLARLALSSDAAGAQARAVLGARLGGVLRAGFVDEAERWVQDITAAGHRWSEAAPEIGRFIRPARTGGQAPDASAVAAAKRMLERLAPATLEERLHAYVVTMDWTYPYGESLDHEQRRDGAESLWAELADELIAAPHDRLRLLDRLCRVPSPTEAFRFARILACRPCSPDHPLELVETAWRAVDASERTDGLMLGALDGTADTDPERFRAWTLRASRDPQLAPLLPSALRFGTVTDDEVSGLLDALSAGRVPEERAGAFRDVNLNIEGSRPELVHRLVLGLAVRGGRWEGAAVDVLSGYLEIEPSPGVEIVKVLETLVESRHFTVHSARTLADTVLQVIRTRDVAGASPADTLLSRIGYRVVSDEVDGNPDELALALLDEANDAEIGLIVHGLLKAVDEFPERRERVHWLLSGRGDHRSKLWRAEHANLFDWADAHLDYAPALLASLTPTSTGFNEAGTIGIHERVAEMLVRYGDRQEVHDALHDALHWRSWIGNTSSYWQALQEPLEGLNDHESGHVRRWARAALESARDALERDLGDEATDAIG